MAQEPIWEMARAIGPDVLWSSVQFGGFTGICGLGLGGVSGMMRSTTPTLFAVASGIQCFTLGTTFWATRKAGLLYYARTQNSTLYDLTPRQRTISSTFAGGVSGATAAALFRGPKNIIPGVVMFSLFGGLGQSLYNTLDHQDHIVSTQALSGDEPPSFLSRFLPMKKLTDEEYEHMLKEKLLRVDAEIAVVDESLGRLKNGGNDL